MGWLDALVGAAGNAARSTANNTVKAASQPSQRQSSPRQQQSAAPSSNFWQALSSAVSRNVQRPQQQQQSESAGASLNIPAQNSSSAGGSFATSAIKEPSKNEKESDEKGIYSETKTSGGGKAREKQPWHQVMDSALGNEGIGGVINDLLSYNGLIGTADTFSPEWAHNPTQMSDRDYALQSLYPDQFKGQEMPSGGQIANMTPEQRRQWEEDTTEGLMQSTAVGLSALPGASTAVKPTLDIANPFGAGWAAAKGAKAALDARKAAKAQKVADKLGGKAAKSAEKAGIAPDAKAAKAGEEAAKAGEEASKVAETVEEAAKPTSRVERAQGIFDQAQSNLLDAEKELLGIKKGATPEEVKIAGKKYRDAKKAADTEAKNLSNTKALEENRESTLMNPEGYFGSAAKNATKAYEGKDLVAPGVAGLGLLGLTGIIGAGNPDKPIASNVDDILKEMGWDTGPIGSGKEKPTQTGLEDEESLAPRTGTLEDQIYGLSRADYNALTQRDQFNKALEDQALRDYYEQTYGADILGDNGYEWFRDLGMDGNMQDKHDLVRDLFGYNLDDKGQSQYGVEGWQELAANSGIDLSGDDEQDIQNILEYMWGADNIINPALYLNVNGDSADYAQTKNLSDNDETGATAAELANYIMNTYGDFDTLANSVDLGGMDSRDFANMMAFGNMMYNGLGSGFSDTDLAGTGAMLGLGGDTAKFGYAGEGEEGFNWQGDSKRNYDPATIYANLAQMYNAAQLASQGQGEAIPVTQFWDMYNGEGVDSAINAHLADDMMAYIQGKNAGKNIKRG